MILSAGAVFCWAIGTESEAQSVLKRFSRDFSITMIIALDGPSGAGKSTVARLVAERLGLSFLDTGAMYRAITLVALERDVHPADEEACAAIARSTDLSFDRAGQIQIDGKPGEPAIRSQTVTRNVSAVSAHPGVREAIVAEQRAIAAAAQNQDPVEPGSGRGPGGVVAEGRDTTTVVFPQADHKFFLSASSLERARRRARQEGTPERLDEICADIDRRDRLDATRAHSPLMQAEDAVFIDADALDAETVVEEILRVIQAREADPDFRVQGFRRGFRRDLRKSPRRGTDPESSADQGGQHGSARE